MTSLTKKLQLKGWDKKHYSEVRGLVERVVANEDATHYIRMKRNRNKCVRNNVPHDYVIVETRVFTHNQGKCDTLVCSKCSKKKLDFDWKKGL